MTLEPSYYCFTYNTIQLPTALFYVQHYSVANCTSCQTQHPTLQWMFHSLPRLPPPLFIFKRTTLFCLCWWVLVNGVCLSVDWLINQHDDDFPHGIFKVLRSCVYCHLCMVAVVLSSTMVLWRQWSTSTTTTDLPSTPLWHWCSSPCTVLLCQFHRSPALVWLSSWRLRYHFVHVLARSSCFLLY